MTTLSDRQKQLLFDYSFGLTSERENSEAEALIAESEEAVELYQSLQRTLAPLDTVEVEFCPNDLTEQLFSRLRQETPADRLGQLLDEERSARPVIRVPLWRNWGEVVAAAAAIVLFVSILFPTIGHMRGRYFQTRCGTQLSSIFGGLRNYASDHDDRLPAVAMTPGSPWWKVGYQGQENYSNTRPAWLLVRQGYVDPRQFLCPGRRDARGLNFDGFAIQNFNDFPSRKYIHFSLLIPCPNANDRDMMQKRILLADRNPLSEGLPAEHSGSLDLRLCEEMMKANSRNHRGRGQNVLLYDGSVVFIRTRRVMSISDDDIYLLRDMSPGTPVRGCEFPSSIMDIFLAP